MAQSIFCDQPTQRQVSGRGGDNRGRICGTGAVGGDLNIARAGRSDVGIFYNCRDVTRTLVHYDNHVRVGRNQVICSTLGIRVTGDGIVVNRLQLDRIYGLDRNAVIVHLARCCDVSAIDQRLGSA